jgi:hypothetical protein
MTGISGGLPRSSRPRRHLACFATAVLMALAGCGPTTVTSNVLRFHDLAGVPPGRSFVITPENGQDGSLEFKSYAKMVAARMEAAGYRPVADAGHADLLVSMVYSVDQGRSEVWSVPVYGYTDYWRRFYGAQAAWPAVPYDVVGTDTHSTTLFTHRLDLRIADAAKLRQGVHANVFEGHALAERTGRDLVVVMPYMIGAMFDNFPGQSGVPVKVSVPETPVRR